MNKIQGLPAAFPLDEDRTFISESEWVIFKLLCKPLDSLTDEQPEALSEATGNQVAVNRCEELIRIVRINRLQGLGSWIARLLAEAGFNDCDLIEQDAGKITDKINAKAGYKICNNATTDALHALQLQWKEAES